VTTARLISVNAGRPKAVPWGNLKRSAIDKQPHTGPIQVTTLGLVSDEQADHADHGGTEQALYAYAREDLDRWGAMLGRELRNGQFGENLTVEGIELTHATIGERWRIGSVLIELNAPRIPCSVFQGFMDEPQWVKRFTVEGRPGGYFRVLAEGELHAGDDVAVEHRPDHGVTLQQVFRALTGHRELVPLLLVAPELQEDARAYARKILGAASQGVTALPRSATAP
jgi:MOSC domain-containing protein YiiM